MKRLATDLRKVPLDTAFYKMQKTGLADSEFGLDNTPELIDGGFGLYSTVNMAAGIGPVKTEFFRIALTRSGAVDISLALQSFRTQRNTLVFGFPGQVFSLQNKSEDFFAYYILFTEDFINRLPALKDIRARYPFMNYNGVQSFQLSEEEGLETEDIIHKINGEIKLGHANMVEAIGLYTQLILLQSYRSYERQQLAKQEDPMSSNGLFKKFIKLVGQHFLTLRKVSDYAGLLHVSPGYLNKVIKSQSDKTAHELIDEMILTEAKAYLLHSQFSVAEIAYKLEFADPSHFNKFFRKHTGQTPSAYKSVLK